MRSHTKSQESSEAWRSFHNQARQDPLRPLTTFSQAAGKTEEREGSDGWRVLTLLPPPSNWWEVCTSYLLNTLKYHRYAITGMHFYFICHTSGRSIRIIYLCQNSQYQTTVKFLTRTTSVNEHLQKSNYVVLLHNISHYCTILIINNE